MPVSRRFEDRGEVIAYAGRDWRVVSRYPLADATVLVVESEGGALALITKGAEVRSVHPATHGAAAPLSDAVATLVSGSRDEREENAGWR